MSGLLLGILYIVIGLITATCYQVIVRFFQNGRLYDEDSIISFIVAIFWPAAIPATVLTWLFSSIVCNFNDVSEKIYDKLSSKKDLK
ncbi:hypothetical protein LAh9_68 [Aeromonas phage LAh_9]|uniref:Uncharacterized protein n=1 Tax=Aeromonas phage LAh_9 TaxID=2591033 RepID=A0A514A112_9CAUD|nr:hypothetical protein HWC32_gp068 [Aeromonas phage LAh_9]QDH46957.1 hypothetical protein LAh9_68 [Aeromonas phage LAh_9]